MSCPNVCPVGRTLMAAGTASYDSTDFSAPTPAPPRVPDHPVDNSDRPHAANRYLNAQKTGRALGHALG